MHVYKIFCLITFSGTLQPSLQNCPEDYSQDEINAEENQTFAVYQAESDTLCDNINPFPVIRNCTDDWTPLIDDNGPCLELYKSNNTTPCPLGFFKIYGNSNDYCYHITNNSTWDYPCFNSGGASVITDLDEKETESLINSLLATNISRYFWLPAHRSKLFHPAVWTIPGPNWGVQVSSNNHLRFQNLIWKNCLALDIKHRILITDSCTQMYPSLCFYINNIYYPAVCPIGYHAFRYQPDNGTCYGIEKSNPETGMTFDNFLQTRCTNPMKANVYSINRFIFMKLAELNELSSHEWCWYKVTVPDIENDDQRHQHIFGKFEGIINIFGTLGMKNVSSNLSCMACEANVTYTETILMIEYSASENQIFLTIYYPSGLWKYDISDKGIQCFSDASGFVKVVDINDMPLLSVRSTVVDDTEQFIEKIVYIIDPVAERSAQYWCEGHTFNFSLINTDKLVVNPKGKEIHVFALTIKYHNFTFEEQDTSNMDFIISYLTEKLRMQKILWMDVYEVTSHDITVLLHVHATVQNKYKADSDNIQEAYNDLKENALLHLPTINCTFVNLTSSLYCLPTTSNDTVILDWELTPVGHISAPKQFCLQSNGLPVKRQCLGSYHNGAIWGEVEGQCDSKYIPSKTTEFLYNVIKGHVSSNDTSHFLTDGLEFVLNDVDSIIPADIYYLSMSLQQILELAQENDTCVHLGDIENMAWVMDRVMNLDYDYLRLAQTLNSTNVIVNSVSNIIEMIAEQSFNETTSMTDETDSVPITDAYQLAIASQFIAQISYPMVTNVTGIAVSKTTDTEDFTNMIVKPLYANTTLDEVMSIKNLEIATWLPLKLIKTLKSSSNESTSEEVPNENLHIVISVYHNDVVFQELISNDHVINSRIVGVSIPGFISNLEYPLPIIFKELNPFKYRKLCGFWDFEIQKSTLLSGLWKTQGCFPVRSKPNITFCECYHLTHFSQLITLPSNSDKTNASDSEQHNRVLNIITLVGCFLSIVGIVGIWITALIFVNWRKKAGTKVLLQLSTAIALPLIFIVIFNLDNALFIKENDYYVVAKNMKPLCIILGSLLHYSILASFMWMLITAVLQFIRYVRVLGVSRPSRFMFKFSVVGWGIPIAPVIAVLSFDVENYVPDSSYSKRICYPKGNFFIFSVMLPICLILLVNVVLFLSVLHSISRRSNDKMKSTDYDLVRAQLRLSIFLFFLLGLTWIFGIFSFSSNLLWSYLFCLTSTCQGFVLFIYFIICDPTTRNMWISLVKPPLTSSSSRNSITSLS